MHINMEIQNNLSKSKTSNESKIYIVYLNILQPTTIISETYIYLKEMSVFNRYLQPIHKTTRAKSLDMSDFLHME